MDYIKTFKDLKIQKEMHEYIKEVAETNRKYYQKLLHKDAPHDTSAIQLDGLPHGNGNAMSLDRVVMYISKYDSMIYLEQCSIENLEKLEKVITNRVKQLDSIDFKVVYMRDIEGKKLKEISIDLGYSEDYIKEISARNKTHYMPTVNIDK